MDVQNTSDTSSIICSCMQHCLCALMYARIPMPGTRHFGRLETWICPRCICGDTVSYKVNPEPVLSGSDRLAGVMRDQCWTGNTVVDSLWDHSSDCTVHEHTVAELQLAVRALDVLLAACLLTDANDVDSVRCTGPLHADHDTCTCLIIQSKFDTAGGIHSRCSELDFVGLP